MTTTTGHWQTPHETHFIRLIRLTPSDRKQIQNKIENTLKETQNGE